MLDPYVLLTFKGTLEKKELPRSCWRCWILTSSLLLKEFKTKEKTPQELLEVLDPYVLLTFKRTREKKRKTHQGLLEVLDPYVLLTFKGTSQEEKTPQ